MHTKNKTYQKGLSLLSGHQLGTLTRDARAACPRRRFLGPRFDLYIVVVESFTFGKIAIAFVFVVVIASGAALGQLGERRIHVVFDLLQQLHRFFAG